MNSASVVVVKVGGSLLSSNEFAPRLRNWLSAETKAHPEEHFVLVVGGGKLVDEIRAIDVRSSLPVDAAHWACIELMDVTARLVGALLPELETVEQFAAVQQRLMEPGVTLLRPSQFLKQVEPTLPGTRLVADWSVTSDSIAGRLAVVLRAAELVLMKSVASPVRCVEGDQATWLGRLADVGFVDAFLPQLAAELPCVRCIYFTAEKNCKSP